MPNTFDYWQMALVYNAAITMCNVIETRLVLYAPFYVKKAPKYWSNLSELTPKSPDTSLKGLLDYWISSYI